RRSLPSTGSRRMLFPRFRGTTKRSDARFPSRRGWFPSLGGTRDVRPHSSLPSARRRRRAWSVGPRGLTPDYSREKYPGPPRFLGNPVGLLPCSQTPAGTATPCLDGEWLQTPPILRRSLPRVTYSRGSIARLRPSL